ncbi:MAG: hypothetical protein SFV22_11740 [Saprospiraceae bacterium]|nr:hypothetical protein [Saprospiraceae bacterium]
MQNLTIAIGKSGIEFFVHHLLEDKLIQLIAQIVPPDKSMQFDIIMDGYSKAENVNIQLTQGELVGFDPVLQSIAQRANGVFSLQVNAGPFTAQYNWAETYWWTSCSVAVGIIHCNPSQNLSNNYKYAPTFEQLDVAIPVSFSFDQQKQAWIIATGTAVPNPSISNPNIPSDSIIQHQDQGWFSSHVSDATAQAFAALNFGQLINNIISGAFASIPASGNLGNGIAYDFSLGDYGLHFPNNDGIQIGVKGGASFQGTDFPGTPPPALPMPLPPADGDSHHLNLFVGGYEVDALNWAFFKAGKLNAVVNPTDLPDPDILKVKTYIDNVSALKPYRDFALQAQITQNAAPVTTFQTVYELSGAVMAALKVQLPPTVYDYLGSIAGNNYVALTALEADLSGADIGSDFYATIERAAKSLGMVVTHDINYALVIQNFRTDPPNPPNIVFNIRRVDILADLKLGIGSNQAQTMQFSFNHANWQATFVSSTVPDFNGADFPSTWNIAGEPHYDSLLQTLGANGVPLPIMQGLQFDFDNAQLIIQDGYVSILADVQPT